MTNPSKSEKALRVARRAGIIRPRDLARHGIPRVYLRRLCQRGLLVQSGRGLYTLPETNLTENHSLAETCKRVPHAVICLLSALQFHGLTTQAPPEIWVALDPKARSPRSSSLSLRVFRMSGKALTEGIEEHRIEGVTVRVFSAAKTVVDCFKYRNKIGLDVALEALKDYRRANSTSMDEVWRFAKICRVARVMRPYLEAVS